MQEGFFSLADFLATQTRGGEIFTCWFAGEQSDFVRFNHGKVRQAGSVEQRHVTLRLIRDGRHASQSIALAGGLGDLLRQNLRSQNYGTCLIMCQPILTFFMQPMFVPATKSDAGSIPSSEEMVDEIATRAASHDLVGILASGPMYRGFANSLGQRNWHEVENFNLDWSLYYQADKAVKSSYAGFEWHADHLFAKMHSATKQITLLQRLAKTIEPGEYRAFLAPRALDEIIGMLSWVGCLQKHAAPSKVRCYGWEQDARSTKKYR